jgi:hypothetical protein
MVVDAVRREPVSAARRPTIRCSTRILQGNACFLGSLVQALARRADIVLQPRLVFLSEPPFANFAGLACALAALATFPLGLIPVAPLAPGIAIAFIGLGLFARDGLLLLIGGVVMGGAVWLAYAAVS